MDGVIRDDIFIFISLIRKLKAQSSLVIHMAGQRHTEAVYL